MTAPAFSICVYCASRSGNDPRFTAAAQTVGQWIGRHGGQLVYGGGNAGLMGVVAQAALNAGARVVGVIPKTLVDKELANRDCTELHIVDTMHERKALMAERSDAFVALPGGIGTFEELFEIWTWRQLGYHDKPVGLLNVGSYYDGLVRFLQHSVQSGLMGDWQMDMLRIAQDPASLMRDLVEGAGLRSETPALRDVI
ncbi:MAG TPA: TIGR00730 family Rossman fold protein [Burkholderiaceae bacterium]